MFSSAAAVTLLLVLSYSTKEVDSFAAVGGVITPPSWEELSHTLLSTQSSAAADSSKKPLVTLLEIQMVGVHFVSECGSYYAQRIYQ